MDDLDSLEISSPFQVDIPGELLNTLAIGLEEPLEVAARHGFTGERWEQLQKWPPFIKALNAKIQELETSGYTFRIKRAFQADDLFDKLYVEAMKPDVPLSQRIEAAKVVAKFGDLEPKTTQTTTLGTGFSINIILPPGKIPGPPEIIVEGTAERLPEETA